MTDKQIIIDEFNASKYAKTAFELAKETLAEKDQLREYCDKLLQRKEKECEELRGVIRKNICSHYVLGECSQNHHDNCVGRNQCIKDLEQEYEELKKQLESTKGLVTIGNKQLAEALKKNEELEKLYKANKNCFEKTEKLLDESEQERMKLKQTLAEIKEIITTALEQNTLINLNTILQKINEVDNGNI